MGSVILAAFVSSMVTNALWTVYVHYLLRDRAGKR